uniref:Uncharacterized protein n=1 Tax=Glossina brevipalpis TaxID=37001 RepID=A0A1A9WKH4_9MUSC
MSGKPQHTNDLQKSNPLPITLTSITVKRAKMSMSLKVTSSTTSSSSSSSRSSSSGSASEEKTVCIILTIPHFGFNTGVVSGQKIRDMLKLSHNIVLGLWFQQPSREFPVISWLFIFTIIWYSSFHLKL